MRIYLILIKCLLVINYSYSQGNLVQDPSFEAYSVCPWNIGDFPLTQWTSVGNGYSATSFNCGSFSSNCGVPKNLYGFQNPSSGNGYIGIRTFGNNSRQYAISQLTTSLSIGQKYFVSFKVNAVNNYLQQPCQTNRQGLLFSINPISSVSFPNFAHVYSSNIVSDTLNWTTVRGSFIADANHKYIAIGNFFNDGVTTYTNLTGSFYPTGFNYFDDICVSTDSLYCEKWTGINEEEALNNIQVFPNPVEDRFKIKTTKQIEDVKLFSLNGIPVDISSINSKEYTIPYVNDGIYILQLRIEGKVLYKKMVVYNNSNLNK